MFTRAKWFDHGTPSTISKSTFIPMLKKRPLKLTRIRSLGCSSAQPDMPSNKLGRTSASTLGRQYTSQMAKLCSAYHMRPSHSVPVAIIKITHGFIWSLKWACAVMCELGPDNGSCLVYCDNCLPLCLCCNFFSKLSLPSTGQASTEVSVSVVLTQK